MGAEADWMMLRKNQRNLWGCRVPADGCVQWVEWCVVVAAAIVVFDLQITALCVVAAVAVGVEDVVIVVVAVVVHLGDVVVVVHCGVMRVDD